MKKTLENYCENCKGIRIWKLTVVNINNSRVSLYQCQNKQCNIFSNPEYLAKMQLDYDWTMQINSKKVL